MYETGIWSDLNVVTSHREEISVFSVHKAVLCSASEFFQSKCSASQRIEVSEDRATMTLVLMSCYEYDFTFNDLLEELDKGWVDDDLVSEYFEDLRRYRAAGCHLLGKARIAADKV